MAAQGNYMADFSEGFVFETDVTAPLTIEGNPIKGFRRSASGAVSIRLSRTQTLRSETVKGLVADYVKRTRRLSRRLATRAQHLRQLQKGRKSWNDWRRRNPTVTPMLAGVRLNVDFKKRRLDGFDFSYANNFTGAELPGVSMVGANFHQAILAGADFRGAHLENANFCRTDLYKTNFTDAHLAGANLQGVQLAMTVLRKADLRRCKVYGVSTWDLDLKDTRDQRLVIKYESAVCGTGLNEEVEVDGLDLAAFVYSSLNNRNIARIVQGASRKWVLILGRFTDGGKDVLEAVRDRLKEKHYVPVIFDFERPDRRDLIETLMLLAGMSAFVVVDISEPRSAPLELQLIASNYGVPIFPILKRGLHAFGMFAGLRKFPWVFPARHFETVAHLKSHVTGRLIEQAEKEIERLTALKEKGER